MQNDPKDVRLEHAFTATPAAAASVDDPHFRGKRRRALLFFWISLSVFLATTVGGWLRYQQLIAGAAGGEAGFWVLGQIFYLLGLAQIGFFLSLVFCIASIPGFKGAIPLLVVEMTVIAMIVLMLSSSS